MTFTLKVIWIKLIFYISFYSLLNIKQMNESNIDSNSEIVWEHYITNNAVSKTIKEENNYFLEYQSLLIEQLN